MALADSEQEDSRGELGDGGGGVRQLVGRQVLVVVGAVQIPLTVGVLCAVTDNQSVRLEAGAKPAQQPPVNTASSHSTEARRHRDKRTSGQADKRTQGPGRLRCSAAGARWGWARGRARWRSRRRSSAAAARAPPSPRSRCLRGMALGTGPGVSYALGSGHTCAAFTRWNQLSHGAHGGRRAEHTGLGVVDLAGVHQELGHVVACKWGRINKLT